MLQQTQVPRVIEKYNAWLHAFPTLATLATAPPARVLTLWSGLGYNNRALRLQKTAQAIVARNGIFPNEPETLEELPGIGPYTARAVLAFAYNRDVPVIDTNIRRIFSRLFFAGAGNTDLIDAQVRLLIPRGRSRDWNNALMDLGSMICTTQSPLCTSCPVQSCCTAYKTGTQHLFFKPQPPQSKFEGSKRQIRGIILKALTAAPQHTVSIQQLQQMLPHQNYSLSKILQQMQNEGFIRIDRQHIRLQ